MLTLHNVRVEPMEYFMGLAHSKLLERGRFLDLDTNELILVFDNGVVIGKIDEHTSNPKRSKYDL